MLELQGYFHFGWFLGRFYPLKKSVFLFHFGVFKAWAWAGIITYLTMNQNNENDNKTPPRGTAPHGVPVTPQAGPPPPPPLPPPNYQPKKRSIVSAVEASAAPPASGSGLKAAKASVGQIGSKISSAEINDVRSRLRSRNAASGVAATQAPGVAATKSDADKGRKAPSYAKPTASSDNKARKSPPPDNKPPATAAKVVNMESMLGGLDSPAIKLSIDQRTEKPVDTSPGSDEWDQDEREEKAKSAKELEERMEKAKIRKQEADRIEAENDAKREAARAIYKAKEDEKRKALEDEKRKALLAKAIEAKRNRDLAAQNTIDKLQAKSDGIVTRLLSDTTSQPPVNPPSPNLEMKIRMLDSLSAISESVVAWRSAQDAKVDAASTEQQTVDAASTEQQTVTVDLKFAQETGEQTRSAVENFRNSLNDLFIPLSVPRAAPFIIHEDPGEEDALKAGEDEAAVEADEDKEAVEAGEDEEAVKAGEDKKAHESTSLKNDIMTVLATRRLKIYGDDTSGDDFSDDDKVIDTAQPAPIASAQDEDWRDEMIKQSFNHKSVSSHVRTVTGEDTLTAPVAVEDTLTTPVAVENTVSFILSTSPESFKSCDNGSPNIHATQVDLGSVGNEAVLAASIATRTMQRRAIQEAHEFYAALDSQDLGEQGPGYIESGPMSSVLTPPILEFTMGGYSLNPPPMDSAISTLSNMGLNMSGYGSRYDPYATGGWSVLDSSAARGAGASISPMTAGQALAARGVLYPPRPPTPPPPPHIASAAGGGSAPYFPLPPPHLAPASAAGASAAGSGAMYLTPMPPPLHLAPAPASAAGAGAHGSGPTVLSSAAASAAIAAAVGTAASAGPFVTASLVAGSSMVAAAYAAAGGPGVAPPPVVTPAPAPAPAAAAMAVPPPFHPAPAAGGGGAPILVVPPVGAPAPAPAAVAMAVPPPFHPAPAAGGGVAPVPPVLLAVAPAPAAWIMGGSYAERTTAANAARAHAAAGGVGIRAHPRIPEVILQYGDGSDAYLTEKLAYLKHIEFLLS